MPHLPGHGRLLQDPHGLRRVVATPPGRRQAPSATRSARACSFVQNNVDAAVTRLGREAKRLILHNLGRERRLHNDTIGQTGRRKQKARVWRLHMIGIYLFRLWKVTNLSQALVTSRSVFVFAVQARTGFEPADGVQWIDNAGRIARKLFVAAGVDALAGVVALVIVDRVAQHFRRQGWIDLAMA